MINSLTSNKLQGGVGDKTPSDKVNPNQLSLGIQIEMEHTNDPDIAREITMDHLTEDPDYYTKLIKAGLAKEFQPSSNSGFGDPGQGLNDPARLGKTVTATPGGNIVGTMGGTPDGHTDGRRSDPIINKTIDIELQERRKLRVKHILQKMREGSFGSDIDRKNRNPIQVFDGPSPAEASPEGLGTFGSGYDYIGYAENKEYSMKKDRLKEIIRSIALKQLVIEQDGGALEAPETPEEAPEAPEGEEGEAPEAPEGEAPEAPEGEEPVTITLDRETAQKLMDILTQQLSTEPGIDAGEFPSDTEEPEVGGDQIPDASAPTDGGDEGSDEEAIGEITFEQSEAIDETKKKWMQKAFDPKKKGKLHKQLDVPIGKKIPADKLAAAAKKGGKLGKRARLAAIVKKFKKK